MDTDVVSFLGDEKGRHREWAPVVQGRDAYISFVTHGEIIAGAIKANWTAERIGEWEDRLKSYIPIPTDAVIARVFGRVRARFKGQINDDDLWIAATSIAFGEDLPLASADKHFDTIAAEFPGLVLLRPEGWDVATAPTPGPAD